MSDKKKIGNLGEELATVILKTKGYYIIRRNFSCPYGEIDIVAIKDKVLSFVEVKTRSSAQYGAPSEAVDLKKQKHIRNAARYFISYYKRPFDKVDFQVMEVTINHIRGLEF